MLGAALFYCDALITPAISVLSAVEGLRSWIRISSAPSLPVTLVRHRRAVCDPAAGHRARSAACSGPIVILWFVVLLAVLGVMEIVQRAAGARGSESAGTRCSCSRAHPGLSLVIIGAVFLAVTGAEALYADMGHFGRKPVRIGWLTLVWPALLLQLLSVRARCCCGRPRR